MTGVWCPGALHHETQHFPHFYHTAWSPAWLLHLEMPPLVHTISLAVNWLVHNHHTCPRMDPPPLISLDFASSISLQDCLTTHAVLYPHGTQAILYICPCGSCPQPLHHHSHHTPTVPLPYYSSLSGPPRIYRITQVNIPIILIMVSQS